VNLPRLPSLSFLRERCPHAPFDFLWYGAVYGRARLLVRAYYLFTLYWLAAVLAGHWAAWRTVGAIDPLWPIFWIEWMEVRAFVDGLAYASLFFMLMALLLPQWRVARAGVFLCFLFWYAFINSFGKIGHDGHLWLAAGFLLIWLPDGDVRRSVGKQHYYLTVIASAQCLMMLTYTMSGVWKVAYGIDQMVQGQIGTFHPDALATLTAFRLLQTNSESLLGPLLLRYPLVGWPMHLGATYLETFAIVAAFRPSLHRLWGIGLIFFHFGTWLLMGIIFQTNIALLGLLMVMSPFYREGTPLRVTLYNLPLLGPLFALLAPRAGRLDRARLRPSKSS